MYHVESKNGGFLSIGKLTGKVITEAARGLAIRTPLATVTDLGTEFGVEVDERGATISRVFRGAVRLQVASSDDQMGVATRILQENESVRVETPAAPMAGGEKVSVTSLPALPDGFVREIPDEPSR